MELGGTISAEHGLGALKRDHAALEHGEEELAVMRSIKDVLDPAGLLNPGRVLDASRADPG